MPRIQDILLSMVFYVYPNREEAINGGESGGTGFFFQEIIDAGLDIGIFCAVTNKHVVFDGQHNPVLRINTKDGKFDIIETNQDEWIPHPYGDDIALKVLGLDPSFHQFGMFRRQDFLTREFIDQMDIGPGDEVIMVGRFRVVAGKKKNLPTAMFGNIAMMPQEPIHNFFTGLDQESFLVDMRSISGFSGSPVMLFVSPTVPRPSQTSTDISGICV